MSCQHGSRRCATWDENEDVPQIKRLREEKDQGNGNHQDVSPPTAPQQPVAVFIKKSSSAPLEQPKFYISSPIQGFTVNKEGGCRYLFF